MVSGVEPSEANQNSLTFPFWCVCLTKSEPFLNGTNAPRSARFARTANQKISFLSFSALRRGVKGGAAQKMERKFLVCSAASVSEKSIFRIALLVALFSIFAAARGVSFQRLVGSLDVFLVDSN